MKYNTLGNTGLKVSRIMLRQFMTFGGGEGMWKAIMNFNKTR
jgi:aryl-alcohol dehydrogenase-like predicted oxidoreductase